VNKIQKKLGYKKITRYYYDTNYFFKLEPKLKNHEKAHFCYFAIANYIIDQRGYVCLLRKRE
jgi:hypothetical protein